MLKSLQDKFADVAGKAYDWGSGWAGKLSHLFKWPRLSSWLTRHFSKSPVLLGIESFVAVSLAVYFFLLSFPQVVAPRAYDGNEMNAFLFTYLSDHPYSQNNLIPDFDNWRARLPGPMITGWLDNLAVKLFSRTSQPEAIRADYVVVGGYRISVTGVEFGCYHATWLLLLFAILILHRKDALLIMLGVFSGLMYNFTIPAGQWFLPWDLPTMFFFTWACLLYDKREFVPLMVVVWLGSLFKETTLCCSLLILLGEHWPLKKRLVAFAGTALACLLTRKLLMAMYGVKTMFFALNNVKDVYGFIPVTWTVLVKNVHMLFSPIPNHVLFTNAGALFIVMLIPWRTRREVLYKILMVVFIIGQFLCGIIVEFRIWYEVLPLGWILISEAISGRLPMIQMGQAEPTKPGRKGAISPDPVADRQTRRVMRGSYWLMNGALLALALGIWVIAKWTPPAPQESSKPHPPTFEELVSSAQKGDMDAQYRVGYAYQTGDGVKQDLAEAANYYQRAAAKGHVLAQNNLGALAMGRSDYRGAVHWFGLAAARGNAEAQNNLGFLYLNGLGVRTNFDEGIRLDRESAQQGLFPAQLKLATLYRQGLGTKPDLIEAYKWLKLAQLQGTRFNVDDELKACAASMTPDQIAAAEKLARELQAPAK